MIGAILSGGYGKRLKPLTDEIPKSLIEIKEKYTIMDRQIYDFQNAGIKEIYILSGHLGEKIEERYGKTHMGMNFHYLKEEKPMGTLYSVRNLMKNCPDQDIVLRNGDTITDLNFSEFIKFSINSPFQMIMFIYRMKSPFGIVETLGDQVTSFKEKPFLRYFINAGVYYLKSSAKDIFFADYLNKDIETTVFPELARRKLIGAYREETFWMGIDSEKDLETVRSQYAGRVDYPWGYMKNAFSGENISIVSYHMKENSRMSLEMREGSVMRIVEGEGMVRSHKDIIYGKDTVVDEPGKLEIICHKTTEFEIISNSK